MINKVKNDLLRLATGFLGWFRWRWRASNGGSSAAVGHGFDAPILT